MSRMTAAAALGMAVLVCAIVVSAPVAAAQGRKPRGEGTPAWDPATVQTVTGRVTATREVGRGNVVMLALTTESEPLHVVLGPKRILDPALARIAPDTEVEVTGSRVKGKQREMLLASKVSVGGKEYALRNEQGRFLGRDGQPLQRQP